jgi:hypothetical protein
MQGNDMNRLLERTVLLVLLVFISARVSATGLDDRLALLLEWFPGEYDNYEQTWQESLDQVAQPHEHLHHIFLPVDAAAIGEHTFFVQQYLDGDPQNVYRQRLYRFDLDQDEQAIRLKIFSFKDEAKYRNAHLRPAMFGELAMVELIERPGCEVFWKYDTDHFKGYMKERACSFVSKRSGKRIYVIDDLRLTADEIWIRDEAFDEDGGRVFGNEAGVHHKNRKVQYYSGWAGVSSAGPAMAMDGANWTRKIGGWVFGGNLDNFGRFVIHDEGQVVPIADDDGGNSGYSVQLARLTYQGTTVPILTLKLIEDATAKTLAYSWAAVGSDRIGLNTRWAQIGLTLQPGQPSYGFSPNSSAQ